jgi:hypothetical protein
VKLTPQQADLFGEYLRIENEWLDALVKNIGPDRASMVVIKEMLMEDTQPIQ